MPQRPLNTKLYAKYKGPRQTGPESQLVVTVYQNMALFKLPQCGSSTTIKISNSSQVLKQPFVTHIVQNENSKQNLLH